MVEISEIILSAFVSGCSCLCSHCLLGDQQEICRENMPSVLKKLASRLKKEAPCPVYINPYRSIEYTELPEILEWNRKMGCGLTRLNVNGTKIRSGAELIQWVRWLKDVCRADTVEISWFGTETYMDHFVHCKGYYQYLMELTGALISCGVDVEHKIFVMNDNIEELNELYDCLYKSGGSIWPAFVDYRGMAKNMTGLFFNIENYDLLPEWVKASYLFSAGRYATEKEWVKKIKTQENLQPVKATAMVVLNEKNCELVHRLSYTGILTYLQEYLKEKDSVIPDYGELAERYGQHDSTILYEFRGLVQKWQEQYINDFCPEKKSLIFSDDKSGFLLR